MNKNSKIVLCYLTIMVTILLSLLFGMYHYFCDSIVDIKKKAISDFAYSGEQFIDSVNSDLYGNITANSHWMEYYNAILKKDRAWIEENVTSLPEINKNIDFIITADLNGDIISGQKNFTEFDDRSVRDYLLKRARDGEGIYRGLYKSRQGIIAVSIAKVYDNYKKKSSGYVIGGKLMTNDYISSTKLVKNAAIEILQDMNLEDIALDDNYVIDSKSQDLMVTRDRNSMDFTWYKPLVDINGQNLGILEVKEKSSTGVLHNNFVLFKWLMYIIVTLFIITIIALWAAFINPLSRKLMSEMRVRMAVEDKRKSLEEQNVVMKNMAYRDGLTGIFNRRFFDNKVQELIKDKKPFMLMMIDIDDFKIINDSYGHPIGDYVLKCLSGVIMEQIRESDMLCRYGGEEFCIILPGCSTDNTVNIARRIKEAVQDRKFRHKKMDSEIQVTISMGVSNYSGENDDIYDIISKTDRALYDAKKNGKNSITFEIVYNY